MVCAVFVGTVGLLAQVGVAYPKSKEKYIINASPKYDPGVKDYTHRFRKAIEENADLPMSNVVYTPNDDPPTPYDGDGITTWDDGHPAPDPLGDYSSWWNPKDGVPRHPVLLVEDMENGYSEYVDYVLPNCERLLAKFREYGLPVIWTNWVRRSWDGNYGALDRFYGPEGTSNEENPMYMYGKDGTDTLSSLAPIDDDEYRRTVRSLHLSKFADLDENGDLILVNMLKDYGVDTIVLVGAWTEDCVLATVIDAVDKYDIDVILVEDGVATSTRQHGHALEIMQAAFSVVSPTQEVIDILDESFQPQQQSSQELGSGTNYFNVAHGFAERRNANLYVKGAVKRLDQKIDAKTTLFIAFCSALISASVVTLYLTSSKNRYAALRNVDNNAEHEASYLATPRVVV